MQSTVHLAHIKANTSYNNCSECRADCERRFVRLAPWRKYEHVSDYLAYVKPRLACVKVDDSMDARDWYREFRKALHRRVTLRLPVAGRKQCDSYLERIGQFRSRASGQWQCHDGAYLRRFVARGASCLDA